MVDKPPYHSAVICDADVDSPTVGDQPVVEAFCDASNDVEPGQHTAAQVLQIPASAVVAFNNGTMPPDVRAQMQSDIEAGRAQLPQGAMLTDPNARLQSEGSAGYLGRQADFASRGAGQGVGNAVWTTTDPAPVASGRAPHESYGRKNFSIPVIFPKVSLRPTTDKRRLDEGALFDRERRYQDMLESAFRSPTVANFAALAATFPDRHAELTQGRRGARSAPERSELDNVSRAFVALSSNQLALAMTVVQERLESLKNDGERLNDPAYVQEVRDVEGMLNLIDSNPRAAQGVLAAVLSSAMGAEAFSIRFAHVAVARHTTENISDATGAASVRTSDKRCRSRRRNPAWRAATRNLCR